MARTTITHINDDLDGSKDAEAVTFAFEGTQYTIDLNKKNKAALAKALQPYIKAGTKVTGRTSKRRASTHRTSSTPKDTSAIRTWAKGEGLAVSDRGRIPQEIVSQYQEAH